MKVFSVAIDVNNYQMLIPKSKQPDLTYAFLGKPLKDWVPPDVYSDQPQLKAGDFWAFLPSGCWAMPPDTAKICEPLLRPSGQLLPLPYKDQVFQVLNVTVCVDCLDRQRTEWVLGDLTRRPMRIKRHVFRPDLLPPTSIFKVPDAPHQPVTIFCYEGVKANPDDEFKPFVEKQGLTGLIFTELWSSED